MKNLVKNWKALFTVCLIFGLFGCASEEGLDGQIIVLKDGRVFELQHRVFDAYVMHKIDAEKLKEQMAEIKRAK